MNSINLNKSTLSCVYIKNYKNVKDTFLTFSNRYLFNYNKKDNFLEISYNPNYIEDFFGERISSISLLVGQNTSGKTNSIIWLLERITSGFNSPVENDDGFIILERSDNYFIIYGKSPKIEKPRDFIVSNKDSYRELRLSSLYYDGSVNFLRENELTKIGWSGIQNISTRFLLEYDYQYHTGNSPDSSKSLIESIDAHKSREYERIAKLLSKLHNTKVKLTDFKFPKYLVIKPNTDTLLVLSEDFSSENFNKKYNTIIDKFFVSGISAILYQKKFHHNSPYDKSFSIVETIFRSHVKKYINIDEFFQAVESKEICMKDPFVCNFIKELKNFINKLRGLKGKYLEHTNLISFDTTSNYNEIRELISNLPNNSLIGGYPINIQLRHDLTEENAISNGEMQILNLLSRVLYFGCWNKHSSEDEYQIIVLDEPDLGLHPQWQKELIYLLSNLINKFFTHSVQIIITTHSPILLSDIPGNLVNILSKEYNREEKLRTFGANIFDIYKNSLFLRGFLGKFAEEKIKEVENCKKDKQYNKLINIIGDNLIRNYLKYVKGNDYNQKNDILDKY